MNKNKDVAAMRAAILELVQRQTGTSFVNIEQLPGARGRASIWFGESNVVFWTGLSEAAATAAVELRKEGKIHYAPTEQLVYVVDGAIQNLPIVKSAATMARGYKRPHWLPVTVEPGPAPI